MGQGCGHLKAQLGLENLLSTSLTCPWFPSQPARAAITKHHELGGADNGNQFYHSSADGKSKIKGPAGLVSYEASLLGLWTAAFSLRTSAVPMPFYKDSSHIGLRLHL